MAWLATMLRNAVAVLLVCCAGLPLSASPQAVPPAYQTLQQAELTSLSGNRIVSLPHALLPSDFAAQGSLVRYRLDWQLSAAPARTQGVYVSKLALSGRLIVNGVQVDACGNAPLEELRCLHQPQLFKVPSSLLHAGTNVLEFEIYATARQMNGLSVVQAGDVDALYGERYQWREFFTVDLQVGLAWLSTLLGLLSLTVGIVLRRESVFIWFGITSIVNAVASLNGIVSHPLVPIGFYNWLVFSSRLVSVPMSFMALLAIFGKDTRRIAQVVIAYSLLAPAAIWFSDNNRTVAFACYVPFVFSCPYLLYRAARWSLASRAPIHAAMTVMMTILFGGGVFDWLRLGGRSSFDGIYVSAYTYSGMLVTIGMLLISRMAAALLQSQKTGSLLERQVAERIAYEVTENIPVGTFTITNRHGKKKPRFSFTSRRFLQITGLDQRELSANVFKALAIVHPDDRREIASRFMQAFREGQPFAARARIVVRGQTRWINVESAPRALSDGSTIWEGVLIDETEQVVAREAAERDRAALQSHLLAQSRMEERERLLRDMHDGFGSQLAGVRMMVEKGRIRPEELPAYLQEVSADLHLVVDTLGQGHITLEDAIYDMRFRTERRFADSGIAFHWNVLLDGLPPLSSRTILQILRIMQEAVHNAIRHADAANITLSALYQADADCLRVSVSDDGKGLPEQPRHGRGLGNMRHRAREIGAQWKLMPGLPGMVVELCVEHLSESNRREANRQESAAS